MLRIGLTGGIASGKSTAARRFEELGIPVIDADVIAHQLVAPTEPAFDEIVATFGQSVINPEGALNRGRLREIVFADAGKRRQLEAILHPRVRRQMLAEIAKLDAAYCVLVIPLLIESRQQGLVDRIVVVDAPDHRRVAWLKERSGLDENQILDIFRAQAPPTDRLAQADDVLTNDGDIANLLRQVDRLHQTYCRLAAAS